MKTWSFISAAALMLVFSCCGPKEQINAGSDGNGSDVRRRRPGTTPRSGPHRQPEAGKAEGTGQAVILPGLSASAR